MAALAEAFKASKPLDVFPDAPKPEAASGTEAPKQPKLSKEEVAEKEARTIFIGNVAADTPRNAIISFIRDGVKAAMKAAGAEIELPAPEQEAQPDGAQATSGDRQRQKKKLTDRGGGIVESARLRSFAISKLAVAPGSSYKAMLKAAYTTGSYGDASKGPAASGEAPAHPMQKPQHEGEPAAPAPAANAYVVLRSASFVPYAVGLSGKVLCGRHVRVDAVSNKGPAAAGEGAPGQASGMDKDPKKTLFLGHLPWSLDEEGVWQLLLPVVKGGAQGVRYVRLLRDRVTRKSKGVAYVGLQHAGAVSAVAKALNGKEVGGQTIKASKCKDAAEQAKARAAKAAKRPSGAYGRLKAKGSKRPRGEGDRSHMGATPGADMAAAKQAKKAKTATGSAKAVGQAVAASARRSAGKRKGGRGGKK